MKLIFKMSDGSEWAVDPERIAVDRANYYARVDGYSIGSPEWDKEVGAFLHDEDTLADWAKNNMEWYELQPVRVKEPEDSSYESEFMNAECWLDRNGEP